MRHQKWSYTQWPTSVPLMVNSNTASNCLSSHPHHRAPWIVWHCGPSCWHFPMQWYAVWLTANCNIHIYIYIYIYNIYSGYKHFTLIDEKTSIPLSVRGAYIATTVPYLNIWCLQYFPLIQRRQAEPKHSSPLESSSQILYRTQSPPRLSSWSRHHL